MPARVAAVAVHRSFWEEIERGKALRLLENRLPVLRARATAAVDALRVHDSLTALRRDAPEQWMNTCLSPLRVETICRSSPTVTSNVTCPRTVL